MTNNDVYKRYFEWMYNIVLGNKKFRMLTFYKLCNHLNEVPFFYIIDMDKNREEDGLDLRHRFGYENNISSSLIDDAFSNIQCSVFEVMVALALRCEETIMKDPEYGNRTDKWFWEMLVSLGLASMNDVKYNKYYVEDTVYRFLNREYSPNGYGGLFMIKNPPEDLRDAEIWKQLCWYLEGRY